MFFITYSYFWNQLLWVFITRRIVSLFRNTSKFFGIKNFPVDWPHIAKFPSPKFDVQSIISYVMFIIWIVSLVGTFTSTLRFVARINRAKNKSTEVFTRSLDDANFNGDNFNL